MRVLSYSLVLIVGALSVFNGTLYAPLYDTVAQYLYLFTRGARYVRTDVLAHMTSLSLALGTLLLAGIPAALYERIRGLKSSTPVSLAIWLLAAALLALPAVMRLLGEE
jgi:hypothetical protein